MTRTALVLGSNGFCGHPLTALLRDVKDVRVVGADIHGKPACELDAYNQLDIADRHSATELIERLRPEWIFNLAGVTTGDLRRQLEVNFFGAIHILEAVRECSPDSRVVLVGSAAEYGMATASQNPLAEDQPCHPVGSYAVS